MTVVPDYSLDTAPRRPSAARRYSFRAITLLLALALGLTSLHSLIIGWFDTGDGGQRRFDDIGWGVIEGVIVLAGVLSQLGRPDRRPEGLRQAALGLLALVVAGAATGAFDPATIVVLLLVGILGWLHPRRHEILTSRRQTDRTLLAAAVALAVPLLAWAVTLVHTAHTVAPSNVHATHQDYAGLTALAIGLALTALLAAVDPRSALPAFSVGAGLLLVGVASLLLDHQADALPTAWAVASIVGGVLFALLRARRAGSVARG
jgi:peptidoglycan/LPS O-acetylase OafA/YrhL